MIPLLRVVLIEFCLGVALFCCVGFGYGLNYTFPLCGLAVVPVSLLMLLLSMEEGKEDSWLFIVAKWVWTIFCTMFGYTFAFNGVFSTPGNEGFSLTVFGIASAVSVLILPLGFLPFVRNYRRFHHQVNSWGLFLLSVMVPICLTASFFVLLCLLASAIPYIGGDFVHPGYAWLDVKPAIMFASFFGIHGVYFVASLAGMALFLFVVSPSRRFKMESVCVIRAIGAIVVLALLCGSIQSLASSRSFYQQYTSDYAYQDVTVGCITGGNFYDKDFSDVSLIMFSELFFNEDSNLDSPDVFSQQRALAKKWNVPVLFGYSNFSLENGSYRNMASLVVPNGKIFFTYQKRYPSPPEVGRMISGPGIFPLIDLQRFGMATVAICQDWQASRYINTAPSVDVFFNPSETWGPIGHLHAKESAVRAIEHGSTMVRCSSDGFSGVYSASAEWSALASTVNGSPIVKMQVSPYRQSWTLYSYIGDVLAFSCLVLMVPIWISVFMSASFLQRIIPNGLVRFFQKKDEGFDESSTPLINQ